MGQKSKVLLFLFLGLLLLLFLFLVLANLLLPPTIVTIEREKNVQYPEQMILNIEVKNSIFKLNKATWCLVKNRDTQEESNWIKVENGYCSFSLVNGEYDIYVKDAYNHVVNKTNETVQVNKILSIQTNKDIFYLYKDMYEKIDASLIYLGSVDQTITMTSLDSSIVEVRDDMLHALNYGETSILLQAEDKSKEVKVVVSPHITNPKVDYNKPYLACKQFSASEADLLDSILYDRINSAGYKTRAGVVAAARFLTLEFSYRVHYFYENGRLNNYDPYLKVDGEGRYYHRGLYLHENKFKEIESKFVGPAIWGCNLQNYTDWGPWVTGRFYPNGLDCSGFVTWALLNGGFDIGDIGAGIEKDHHDLTNLGERVLLTEELMQSGRVKVGDLIGLDGHAALLAGIDEENYYIAESLNTTKGVVMTIVPKSKLVHNSIYKYVVLMDSVYASDGNLTSMWT